jgi:hypothetical protein
MNVFDLHQAVPDAETGAVLCAADINDHGELIQVKKYVKNGSRGIFVFTRYTPVGLRFQAVCDAQIWYMPGVAVVGTREMG